MLRLLMVAFSYSALSLTLLVAQPLHVEISAEAAILVNADTGAILYEKNAHQQYHPASTTKVATALFALFSLGDRIDKMITADRESLASISFDAKKRSNFMLPAYWLEPDGTHMGIKNEEQLSFKDLLFGLMIASANDAANLIAKEIGGAIPDFMDRLNIFLKERGCRYTKFCNPHGLHHPKHLTTAYDMALITKEAMKYSLFREIVSTERYRRPKTNKQDPYTFAQGNHLVRKGKQAYYPKAIGVKTGYIAAAQHTLVAAAKDKDRTLIAVLFKCKTKKETFEGATKLFEEAFNQQKVERILLKAGQQDYVLDLIGAVKPIKGYIRQDIAIQYYPAEEPVLHGIVKWHDLKLPIEKGQLVGDVQILSTKGRVVRSEPLFAEESVSETWSHWIKSFF